MKKGLHLVSERTPVQAGFPCPVSFGGEAGKPPFHKFDAVGLFYDLLAVLDVDLALDGVVYTDALKIEVDAFSFCIDSIH